MAASEIAAMIPSDVLKSVKAKDPRPLFKAFVIGHEGEARGRLVGVGNVVKRWFKSMVEKLHELIQPGLRLFHGHVATNDAAGRIPVGEVVGKRLLNIKGGLSSVVACWIYPHYRHLPFDVASIEADIDLREDRNSNLYVTDVKQVTGIALGNSEIDTPGFPRATLLGQLQAFAKHNYPKGDENMITLEEVKQAIQENKFRPSDLYDPEALFADPIISERVREKISNVRGYDIRKFEELTKERVALEKRLEEKERELKKRDEDMGRLKTEMAKSRVGALFTKQREERKLDERQVKFIEPKLATFSPKNPDEAEKEFNAYLDALLDEYKKNAEIFGVKLDDGKGAGGTGTEKSRGTEPDESLKKTATPEDDYLDPGKNPLIRLDPEA